MSGVDPRQSTLDGKERLGGEGIDEGRRAQQGNKNGGGRVEPNTGSVGRPDQKTFALREPKKP